MNYQMAGMVVILGLIGGGGNAILNPPLRPFRKIKHGYDPGWIGNIIIGGLASFIVWGFGLGNPEAPQVYATAILSGIGGARIIQDYLDKRILNGTINDLVD